MTFICDDSLPMHAEQRPRRSFGLLDLGRGVAEFVRRNFTRYCLIGSQDHLVSSQNAIISFTLSGNKIGTYIVAGQGRSCHSFVFGVVGIATEFATDDVIRDLLLPVAEHRQRADSERQSPCCLAPRRRPRTDQSSPADFCVLLFLDGRQNKRKHGQSFACKTSMATNETREDVTHPAPSHLR